ncbi:VanW family protein [Neisseria sp. Ec49-e6-T10]|uniref:VanW family protein n=1 Tax=Neisseria sp. Ec49-e6-T10 TaxID=3140744 RepID=UPI003EB88FDD
MRRPLSHYHPLLYWLRVWQRRIFRYFSWHCSGRKYSCVRQPNERLPYRYKKHTSKLIRRLGESDIQLQYNKVTNLKLAVNQLNGVIIRPSEYFSFCRLVGRPTKKRGFVEGMELSFGQARSGIGGGICQISNLIHWLALHSELQVVERANHSFDPFPDDGRILPFGSGAAIFYNFIDLVLYNPTQKTFQLSLHVGEHQLEGELLCEQERAYSYHIYEKRHAFTRKNNVVYRQNEIWRDTLTKYNVGGQPKCLRSDLLYQNDVVVKYAVDEARLATNNN